MSQRCRRVYISDSVLVELGISTRSIGDNTNFDFSTFLKIVNCDFVQTFSIDSMQWHGGRFNITLVGNSC